MKPVYLKSILSTAIATASFYQAAAVQAQSDSTFGLEEIVVTAQRRSESLQDVPVSVHAVSSEALEMRAVNDIYQLSLASPGLQAGEDDTFTIRGAGTLAFQSTLDSSVAVALDEVNLGRRFLIGPAFNDVERIEVLNGPQGLLFGKNASAGLINITTRQPQMDVVEGAFDVQHAVRSSTPGDGTSTLARGVLNLPLNDSSALRINAHYTTEDSLVQVVNSIDNPRIDDTKEDYGLKVKYLNHLSDNLSLYLIGEINKESGGFDRSYRELGEGSAWGSRLEADGITASDDNFAIGANSDTYRDVDLGGLTAKLTYDLANGMELINIFAWRYYELDQNLGDWSTTAALDINHTQSEYRQFSNEIRLVIPASEKINGQVGLYFFDLQLDQDALLAGAGGLPDFLLPDFPFCVGEVTNPPCTVNNDYFVGTDTLYTLETQSIAAFGQFDFNVTEQLKLIAGLRYTYDDLTFDLDKFQRYSYFTTIGAPADIKTSDTDDNISGKLGLQYAINEDVMTYLTVGRGYKGPGYSDSPAEGQDPYVRPETVDNIEAGIKSTLFDRRLIVNLSLFHQQFEDYQVQAFDGNLGQSIIQNAASLTSQGAEISISALPFENLTLNASAIFLDATFDEFEGAACYPGQADQSCSESGSFDASGYKTPLAADFTATFDATYEFTVNDNTQGYFNVNYYHRDPVNYVIARPDVSEIGNVDTFGLTLGARFNENLNISLFCKNCTNQLVPTAIGIDAEDSALNNTATTIQTWGYNSVRNVGVKVKYEF